MKHSNHFLDLRGIKCPLNYVKAKILLEKLNAGDNLEIWLDDDEAVQSVPASIAEEGSKIEKIEKINNYYKLLITKG